MRDGIVLREVHKWFGPHHAVKGVSFSVAPGEIVGLLGPNGSGKTTTLRLIAGYLAPERGTVEVCGEPLGAGTAAARQHIGYLPERPPLYDTLSVAQYLEFVAGARLLKGGERRAEIARVIAAYDLGAVARKPVGRLSKGYRQRVGLAQASLGQPPVLLLDEATNGLDPLQIVEARRMICDNAQGRAVIFSSHLMQEVAALCTRAVILYNGRLLGDFQMHELQRKSEALLLRLNSTVAPNELVAHFAALPGVAKLELTERDGDETALRCVAAPGQFDALPQALAAATPAVGRLLSVAPEAVDLEAIFVNIVRADQARMAAAAA